MYTRMSERAGCCQRFAEFFSGHPAFQGRQIFSPSRHSDDMCSLLSERGQFSATSTLLFLFSHSPCLLILFLHPYVYIKCTGCEYKYTGI